MEYTNFRRKKTKNKEQGARKEYSHINVQSIDAMIASAKPMFKYPPIIPQP